MKREERQCSDRQWSLTSRPISGAPVISRGARGGARCSRSRANECIISNGQWKWDNETTRILRKKNLKVEKIGENWLPEYTCMRFSTPPNWTFFYRPH